MVARARTGLVAAAVALGALALAPATASASLDQLLGDCSIRDAADGNTGNGPHVLPFRLCDDGIPNAGGTDANPGADKAIPVPAAYQGTTGEGLPGKDTAAAATVPGNDNGNVAIDANLTLPDPTANPMPAGGYPLVVFMHGCCGGTKTSWQASTIDPGNSEQWHYSNAWFAARGYVVLTYTARGFVREDSNPQDDGDTKDEGSTGETQLDSRRFEINDFQHLAGQLADKGDLDTNTNREVRIDPQKVVTTGGSYGGGFSWMALTDPVWNSPGNGTAMKLAASAPKYGWTDLVESLVPNGVEPKPTNPADADEPFGFAKRSIVTGLYATGKTSQHGSTHTTFPPAIDTAFACLEGADPYEANPACTVVPPRTIPDTLAEFLNDRSAYYQNHFFTKLDNNTLDPVPVFSAGTFTDPLFPPTEHRRMAERLEDTVANYPIQEYYGDYQHFVQNKRKEWADMCGADHHVCAYGDYPDAGGGEKNLNTTPQSLVREVGVTTRLNRFVDHYAQPPANPNEGEPVSNVTASLQTCPDNVTTQRPLDEPGDRFTAGTFDDLTPGTFTFQVVGSQPTSNKASPNNHAANADPVFNERGGNLGRCPVEQAPGGAASAGPGVATYDSNALTANVTLLGPTEVTVQHTGAGAGGHQLNARLYDLFPNGRQVMVDRGVKRVVNANGTTTFLLRGNGWRFPKDHRIRIELAQDDDPHIKSSQQPSSLLIASVKLELPTREASATTGGRVPPPPSSGGSSGGSSGSGSPGPGGGGGGDQSSGRPGVGPSNLMRVGFGAHVSAVRRGVFYVRCRARGTGRRVCAVSVYPRSGASAPRRIGYGRRVVRRRSARVRVKLNRRGRRMLRRRRRGLKVTLRMRVRDGSGRVGRARKRVRLKRR